MIRRNSTAVLLIILPWMAMAAGTSRPAPGVASDSTTPASWSMLVRASLAGASDSLAVFGIRPDATSDYDSQYEIPRPPPPPGTSVQVYFPHDGGNWPALLGNKFAVDYSSPISPAWRMIVETNAGNVAVTLRWDTAMIALLPESYHLLMEDSTADSLILLRTTQSYTFTYTQPRVFLLHAEFTSTFIETATGWNILSVPGIVTDNSAAALFPGGISPAYDFDSAYHARDSMSPGRGYWMKFASPSLSVMSGLSIDSLLIPVRQGWNMIGALSRVIPHPSSPEIISSFYEYAGGYQRADSLVPGKGYWVKIAADGFLGLSSSASKTAATNEQPWMADTETLNIRPSTGTGTTLHLLPCADLVHPEAFELPPVPPGLAFDARFADGSGAVVLPFRTEFDHVFSIVLQSEATTIFLEAGRGGSTIGLFVETGPDQWRAITGTSEPVALTFGPGRTIIRFRASNSASPPAAFRLDGNYPNPFNPSTIIRFQIPEEALLSLLVSDPTGRTIVQGSPLLHEPGPGSWTFDAPAQGLATGIYFYTVYGFGTQTGRRYSGSGKMIFLK